MTPKPPAGKFEGLPPVSGLCGLGVGVRPILENSTACQIIDAIVLSSSRGLGWLRLFVGVVGGVSG